MDQITRQGKQHIQVLSEKLANAFLNAPITLDILSRIFPEIHVICQPIQKFEWNDDQCYARIPTAFNLLIQTIASVSRKIIFLVTHLIIPDQIAWRYLII